MPRHMHLVRCANYNGNKNVLFMMAANDDRLGTANYTDLGRGIYFTKAKLLRLDNGLDRGDYQVYPDWSVKLIPDVKA